MSEDATPSRLVRALAFGGVARVLLVTAEGPARRIVANHGLEGDAARLAAEALVGNVLLSAHVKGEERLLLELASRLPALTYSGEVWSDGSCRARFHPQRLPTVHGLQGTLCAVKWDARRELYRGVAELAHESMEAAFQGFLSSSQQTVGLVRLQAVLGDGGLAFAGGALLELLPGGLGAKDFEDLVGHLRTAPLDGVLAALRQPGVPAEFDVLGVPLTVLEDRPLQHRCTCSLERVEGTLVALGVDELASLIDDPGLAEVTCHFCNTRFEVGPDRLRELIASLAVATS